MNSELFFEICRNPQKIDAICVGNKRAKIIWAAYFYLSGIGKACVNFYGDVDYQFDNVEKDFSKAEILCPNEKWLLDAKRKIKELRSLNQKKDQTGKDQVGEDNSNIFWGIVLAIFGYFVGGFVGLFIGWLPAILFSSSYDSMVGLFAIIGAIIGALIGFCS